MFRGADHGITHPRATVRPKGWPVTSGVHWICRTKRLGGLGVGAQPLPPPTSLCDFGKDLPLRGLSFLICKVRSGLVPPQKTRRLQCPGREARRRMRARGPRVSPGPPALLAPAGTCRTSWGPWSGRGRAAVQDALPHPRPDRGLGRGGRSSGAPPPMAPPRPRPRPRLLNALAAAAASSEPLACPRRQLRSDRRGHGGVPGPDHVASAASTARAAPTLRPSPRPGHGRPRRPPERGATSGTRGRAPGGRRAAAAGGRRGTGPRRRGGSRGCAAPPRGWAWSGARAPPRLLWGGTPDLPQEGDGGRRVRVPRS